jgi:hypothetical protein
MQSYGQQGFGQQYPQQFGQQYPQLGAQQGQGQGQLPVLVTELSLRCAATAVSAVTEQLRMDPQIVMGIQAQGQIPPHAWSTVLTECARRIAPVVHAALTQIISQGQGQGQGQLPGQQMQQPGQFGQGQGQGQFPGAGQFGQFPGQQMQQPGQFGQGQGQGQFGQQPQYGQPSGLGM